ncbi:MAG: DUF1573 domain-containing protein [Bacteroides sp.]|nr:DUF1573 domain-containing protein [Bacteroides sp.]
MEVLYPEDRFSDGIRGTGTFFHPKSHKDLFYILRRDRFGLPVCIDEENEIHRLNQFPQEMAFQTFLLDEENRVVVIGNPVYNPRVTELYYHTILGKEPVKTPVLYTQVEADRYSADLGSFNWRLPAEANFTIRNRGNRLWVIEDIITSCGCISIEYDKEPLPPGGERIIKVLYKADHPEHFSKSITLYSNAEGAPLQFGITGYAR